MDSLEFIKMHVDGWPANSHPDFKLVTLSNEGVAYFGFDFMLGHQTLDLSEHFAPDYYDGEIWTREQFEACGSDETVCGKPKADFIKADEKPTLWEPTINSIVDVGGCDGVVKAIDGEHCWVLKDTSMYDTYHKGSLKQPTGEDIRAVMDATWFTQDAAEILVDKLDIVGYKIVRKGESIWKKLQRV